MKMTKEMFALISNTESMDMQEKKYWVEIWDRMNDEQQTRLFVILNVEKTKISHLERNFQKEIASLNTKLLAQWR